MARVLRNTVITGGVTYARGTAETAELAKKITNPRAWEGEPDPAPRRRGSRSAPTKPAEPKTEDQQSEEPKLEEPPRGGEGSSEEKWREYATALGIEVPEDAGRDDIVALVDAHAGSNDE